jgi:hypothetical protein
MLASLPVLLRQTFACLAENCDNWIKIGKRKGKERKDTLN